MKAPAKSFQDLLVWKKVHQFVLNILWIKQKIS